MELDRSARLSRSSLRTPVHLSAQRQSTDEQSPRRAASPLNDSVTAALGSPCAEISLCEVESTTFVRGRACPTKLLQVRHDNLSEDCDGRAARLWLQRHAGMPACADPIMDLSAPQAGEYPSLLDLSGGHPANWSGPDYRGRASGGGPGSAGSAADTTRPKTEWVSGYTRKDGTYVQPYARASRR